MYAASKQEYENRLNELILYVEAGLLFGAEHNYYLHCFMLFWLLIGFVSHWHLHSALCASWLIWTMHAALWSLWCLHADRSLTFNTQVLMIVFDLLTEELVFFPALRSVTNIFLDLCHWASPVFRGETKGFIVGGLRGGGRSKPEDVQYGVNF